MSIVEVPTIEDIYNIALLVHKGWRKEYFSNRWYHPSGKKFPEVQNCFGEVQEVDTWPFEDALNEVELSEETT